MGHVKKEQIRIFTTMVILVMVVIFMVVILNKQKIYSTQNTLTSSTSNNTNTVTVQTYHSSKLGIQFSYADQDLGQKVVIQESGDKAFVYFEGTNVEDGQSVQVFSKSSTETLQQAVENKFLSGYNRADCFVQDGTDVHKTPPISGVAVVVAFTISQDVDSDGLDNADKCPKNYSLTSGVSFFWTDQDNSERFVFFNIGQYYILGDNKNPSWHTTLRFIE